jgi:hypothetical protein
VPPAERAGNLNVWIALIEFLDQKYLSHGHNAIESRQDGT